MATRTILPQYGFLSVTGRDALKFMQGYTTCDVERMTPEQSRIGAICNIQGRMVASALIVKTADGLLLRMSQDLINPVMEFLKKYIVFSKAEMADLSQSLNCFGVTGEIADAPAAAGAVVEVDHGYLINLGDGRVEIWSDSDSAFADLETGEIEDWMRADINSGVAWVTAATSEEFIPQMFDYHSIGGIDFDKGCYLGQEIVARMQYRGKVNRKLFRGERAGLDVGDAIVSGGKQIGTVVTASAEHFLAVIQSKDDGVPEIDNATLSAIDRN